MKHFNKFGHCILYPYDALINFSATHLLSMLMWICSPDVATFHLSENYRSLWSWSLTLLSKNGTVTCANAFSVSTIFPSRPAVGPDGEKHNNNCDGNSILLLLYLLICNDRVCAYVGNVWQDVCVSIFSRDQKAKVKNAAVTLLIEVCYLIISVQSEHCRLLPYGTIV